MAEKKVATKKLGSAKVKKLGSAKSKKYFVSDPEKADREFDIDGEKIVLKVGGGAVEVSKNQADFLKKNFPYLVVEAK